MSKYNDILKGWQAPEGKSSEQAWTELQAKIDAKSTSNAKVIRFSWKPMVSVAAAAAIIVGLILFWPDQSLREVATVEGQHLIVELPDHSTVELNATSSVAFAESWTDAREVRLSGQAFFQVEKGSKFQVVSQQGVVEVLGTSFDVFDREQGFEVTCRTGKVRVSVPGSVVEIVPGFRATLSNGRLLVSEFDQALADWRSGEFHYNEAPLNDVFDEVERQFGVEIQRPELSQRFYTGRFNSKNLQEALQLICLPMGLQFEVKNQTVLVRENDVINR